MSASHGNSRLARLARPLAERAILRLAAIVDSGDEPPGARVAAARALLEFSYGKPARRPRAAPTPLRVPERSLRIEWAEPTE
jgi:hypothetical protein